jgi:3-oxoacyl-[acyl-carrier protein] reductase
MRRLAGRAALITGASQGLGAAIARTFVAEGASVFLCARNNEDLEATRTRLAANASPDQQVLAAVADVADPKQVEAWIAGGLAALGRIDALVNNAGVYGPFGVFEEVPWEEWVAALQINLLGTAYACRAVIPHFKARRYGKIINLSGGGATAPLPRISSYAVAKAAVVRLTETLAEELREYRIDVNAIAPGALATRMTEQLIGAGPDAVGADFHNRIVRIRNEGGTPLDRASDLSVYLASNRSDGITGRLISAVWDPWEQLHDRMAELASSDIYTLRRIVPGDRGKDWGRG